MTIYARTWKRNPQPKVPLLIALNSGTRNPIAVQDGSRLGRRLSLGCLGGASLRPSLAPTVGDLAFFRRHLRLRCGF
jgi:hypothetical protein